MNYNFIEVNSDIEDLLHRLAKRIDRVMKKDPDRVINILKGVQIAMHNDAVKVSWFIDMAMKVNINENTKSNINNNVTQHEQEMLHNINVGINNEIYSMENAANFVNAEVRKLGPGNINPNISKIMFLGDIKQYIDTGDFNTAREMIRKNWVPLNSPEPSQFNVNFNPNTPNPFTTPPIPPMPQSVPPVPPVYQIYHPMPPAPNSDLVYRPDATTIPSPQQLQPNPVSPSDETPVNKEVMDIINNTVEKYHDEAKAIQKKKHTRYDESQIEVISKIIAANPNVKGNKLIKIIEDVLNIKPSHDTVNHIRTKVTHTKISDRYFKFVDDKVIPIGNMSHRDIAAMAMNVSDVQASYDHTISTKIKNNIALKLDEAEYMIKRISNDLKTTDPNKILQFANNISIMHTVPIGFLQSVISGEYDSLDWIKMYKP